MPTTKANTTKPETSRRYCGLLYDYGKSSQSILLQMGIKQDTVFLDSRVHDTLAVASMKGAWPRTPFPYRCLSLGEVQEGVTGVSDLVRSGFQPGA